MKGFKKMFQEHRELGQINYSKNIGYNKNNYNNRKYLFKTYTLI